jgi:formamidopyrimidine-DNA glycosylase
MPELPEVETVRRGLAPVLIGRRIVRVELARPDLRFPLPPGFAAAIEGHGVEAVERRAKHLLVFLSGGLVLMAHLGMSGRFRIFSASPPPREPHDHVAFTTDEGVTIRFHDPRRFGFMDLCRAEKLACHPMLARLGPEPLGEAFTAAWLSQRLAGRLTSLKAAILDQANVAGMGNIYACESLFRARLSPTRIAGSLSGRQAERLRLAIRAVLTEAIAAGGSSLRDHRQPSGELGTFQHGFAVYGRTGEACPGCTCLPARTGGIRRIVQGGRSTFYCAARQR